MPFPIHEVLTKCAAAVDGKYAPAAMFGLRDEGYGSLYEQLISSLISVRTYDETSTEVSRALFQRAKTPEAMVRVPREELIELIAKASYPGDKADYIRNISQQIVDDYGGETPADYDKLVAFKGVGPKVASLALGVALNHPIIAVDIHVHRITNRWGYVATKTPEKTMLALREKLPEELRVEINRVLVPFGKHVCRGRYPKCRVCPVERACAKVGV